MLYKGFPSQRELVTHKVYVLKHVYPCNVHVSSLRGSWKILTGKKKYEIHESMVFLFKIACFKNSWKKSFFCWFMCKQHCKLYSKVGSFNHKNMLLNHKHLPPPTLKSLPTPIQIAYIYILVEDLDTHWLIWNQEKREREHEI